MKSTTRKPKKPGKSILSKATPVNELEQEGSSAVFYGRSGTGKTALSGTYPKPMLIIDLGEKGTDTLSSSDGVSVIRPNDWDELREIYQELRDSDHGFKTVSVDALPGLQQLAIVEAKAKAKKSEEDQTSQRDMGEATKLMNVMIYDLRDLKELGMEVVFIAHDRIRETDTEDADAIAPECGPNLMPGITKTLLGCVDIVGYTFIKVTTDKKKIGVAQKRTVSYCLRIGPHEVFATKIRVPVGTEIPEYIENPSYDDLMALKRGKVASTPKGTKTKRSVKLKKKGK